MNMFTYVNEVAVVGTALFMVAVAMIWYSEYLFQEPWRKAVKLTPAELEDAASRLTQNFLLTLVSYTVAIFMIANIIGYAQVFEMSVKQVVALLSLGFIALLTGFVVWEQRSLTYYFITAGFSAVFIIVSSLLLFYWPW